jgi:hypothetical protein
MIKPFIGIAILVSTFTILASKEEDVVKSKPAETIKIPAVKYEKTWKCLDCNENEQYVLEQLQTQTKISDKNALATIMGNIKQESMFKPDICEGGSRVPYENCLRGGYGLIKCTTDSRYLGLGSFCKKYDCNPSSLEGQVQYMINENQFQKVLPEFEGVGNTIFQYMTPSYYWLGWGIKGYREHYAYDYIKKMVLV